jgi:uncharacterized NAD(P)/FAD-binding protein YdhS
VRSLVEAGLLELDRLGLGVRTGRDGRALLAERESEDLLVLGTLRKPELWESTAVPELRVQAERTAEIAIERVRGRGALT